MSDTTGISWTDHTFNPWWGCARVSPACRFCYADRDASRYGFELWRRHGERRMLSDANWAKPLKWNREAERAGVPAKVFCASMADVFEDHPSVAEPRKRLWEVIEQTPWLTWQLLTKRIENVASMASWGEWWPPNVWLGTSVENQKYADLRVPLLLSIPAQTRFLSCEPLLGPVDLCGSGTRLTYWLTGKPDWKPSEVTRTGVLMESIEVGPRIDWVICGGESGGPKRRVMDVSWLTSIVSQCRAARVPVWTKQDSGSRSGLRGRIPDGFWVHEFPEPATLTAASA